MFHLLTGVLSAEDLARVDALAAEAVFRDGRLTNPGHPGKNNLQAAPEGPAAQAADLIGARLNAHPDFRRLAHPRRMTPPRLCRYETGMAYGRHVDGAIIGGRRADLSCTVFLKDRDAYEGGELVVSLGSGVMTLKEPAGSAVLYPSDTVHEVRPVTRGERLVAIAFIESRIADPKARDIVAALQAIHRAEFERLDPDNRVALNGVIQNLIRRWAD